MRNVKKNKRCEAIIPTVRTNPDYSLYKTILETSMDGFWIIDRNGNILEVNNAYCKLMGYSRQELLTMNSEIRSLTFELSNPLLYEIGVESAVETWLKDQIQNKCGIKCEFKTKGPKINLDEEKRGFDLFNLHERLEYLGGRFEIQNAHRNGTLASIYVPLESREK